MADKNIKSKNLNNKFLLLSGAIAALFFTFSWIIQEAFRVGYNPLMIPVSSLAIGPLGWIQTITFFITGILMILFAYALLISSKREYKKVSKWGYIVIAICGIGLIGAGCFVTDPMNGYPQGTAPVNESPSISSILHQLFSALLIFGTPVACFIFGNYFTQKKELKWLIYSFLTGIILLLLFLLTSMGFSQIAGLQYCAGLLQRISLTLGFLWIFTLSIYYFRK